MCGALPFIYKKTCYWAVSGRTLHLGWGGGIGAGLDWRRKKTGGWQKIAETQGGCEKEMSSGYAK